MVLSYDWRFLSCFFAGKNISQLKKKAGIKKAGINRKEAFSN